MSNVCFILCNYCYFARYCVYYLFVLEYFSGSNIILSDCIYLLAYVCVCVFGLGFYARKQLCFQRVLAIAILSVCLSVHPSVCHTGGSGKNGPS